MNMRKMIMLFALALSFTAVAQETIFPAKFTAPAEYNTGKVHISVLSRSEHQMTTNFLFERGSHNSWHYHPNATQVLMVLNGEAYYQEEGKPKQLLRKGDVVTTAPNVRHWNGATPWSNCECMTVSDLVPGKEHAVQLRKVIFSPDKKRYGGSKFFTLHSSLFTHDSPPGRNRGLSAVHQGVS